jgi:bis(5'-nucleosyl)-tetraphosphatase (symmetrical)
MRVFLGDIQGCADELDELLAKLALDPSRDRLHCVGDLVNRGPHSLRVLRTLRQLGATTVLGNHDLHLLTLASGERTARPDDTLDEVLSAPDREEILQWLREQPLVRQWDDLWLVHAGLHPHWSDPLAIARPLESQIRSGHVPWASEELAFLTRVRECDAQGRRPGAGESLPGQAPWDHFYRGTRTVVCGHWAMRGLYLSERIRSLDSGCVWGGALSAWIAEEDRVVQVKAHRVYSAIGS